MIDPYLLLWALPRGRRPLAHAAYGLGVMIGVALAVMLGIDITGMDDPCYYHGDVVRTPWPTEVTAQPPPTTTELAEPNPCYMFCDG